ncbi:MAG: DUF3040 domain-containing protein [Actinomycetota bacterium]|nr:DUF3040 domain-containing protein [Actinomycetota bacterium]
MSLREVIVPLSEHEQRLLEQMEQQLSVEDPKFASAMRGSAARVKARRRMILGALGVLVGLGLVLLGVAQGIVLIGIAGFAVMVAGAWLAVTPARQKGPGGPVGTVAADGTTQPRAPKAPRGQRGSAPAAGKAPRGRKGRRDARRSSGGFMSRMEQRWERRRGGGWDV